MTDPQRRADARVVVRAPGRVNLMGDHTDYVGGLALPMAIDLATTVVGRRMPGRVHLTSDGFAGTVELDQAADGSWPPTAAATAGATAPSAEPGWGRYVAAVVAELVPAHGFEGVVSTTLPVGAGLSSSAALEVAVALALVGDQPAEASAGQPVGAAGDDPTGTSRDTRLRPFGAAGWSPLALAQACQRAEHRASGVPCGLMDQLTAVAGVAGHALLVDFTTLEADPVPVPEEATIVVVHSGQSRRLEDSAYGVRRQEVEAAQRQIGPLRQATLADVATVTDPAARARARHVVTENARVGAFAAALRQHDLTTAGTIMGESHVSNRDDFEASTPVVDDLVDRLGRTPGVHGVRLVGGGFGGCVVALTEPGALDEGWTVRPSAGASISPG